MVPGDTADEEGWAMIVVIGPAGVVDVPVIAAAVLPDPVVDVAYCQ